MQLFKLSTEQIQSLMATTQGLLFQTDTEELAFSSGLFSSCYCSGSCVGGCDGSCQGDCAGSCSGSCKGGAMFE